MTHPLVDYCADLFGVPAADIVRPNYWRADIMPARFALYAALHRRGRSRRQIAEMLGRERTTIRHGLRRAEGMAARSESFARKLHDLATVPIAPASFRPTAPDVLDFVCHAAGAYRKSVLKSADVSDRSDMLLHITTLVAVRASVPVDELLATLRIPRARLARYTADRFTQQWGRDQAARDLLWRVSKQFPQKTIA